MDSFNKVQNDPHGGKNLLTVMVVVNGKPWPVTINQNEKVAALVREALRASASTGRKDEDYVLKSGGIVLQPDQKIEAYGLKDGAELFLSLDAGHGG